MEFKDRAIYRLPNGRELVAGVSQNTAPVLYNLDAPDADKYELNEHGRLLLSGRLTAWGVDDLVETGRTLPSHPADGFIYNSSQDGTAAQHDPNS